MEDSSHKLLAYHSSVAQTFQKTFHLQSYFYKDMAFYQLILRQEGSWRWCVMILLLDLVISWTQTMLFFLIKGSMICCVLFSLRLQPASIRPVMLQQSKIPLPKIIEIFYDISLDMKLDSIAVSNGFCSRVVDEQLALDLQLPIVNKNTDPITSLRSNFWISLRVIEKNFKWLLRSMKTKSLKAWHLVDMVKFVVLILVR